ncbi:hypothetical protein XHC_1385 [Xanthomonas hortorum pv. carotae str. M081]|nr:hypothetical protein XHC_1385 [Xanthomonas hortorum pv. carotae str. M081]
MAPRARYVSNVAALWQACRRAHAASSTPMPLRARGMANGMPALAVCYGGRFLCATFGPYAHAR